MQTTLPSLGLWCVPIELEGHGHFTPGLPGGTGLASTQDTPLDAVLARITERDHG